MVDFAISPELKMWLDGHPGTFLPLVVLGLFDEPGGHVGFHSFWSDIEERMTPREREDLQKHLGRVSRLFAGVLERESLGDVPRSN